MLAMTKETSKLELILNNCDLGKTWGSTNIEEGEDGYYGKLPVLATVIIYTSYI
jgi:hypothetical protein